MSNLEQTLSIIKPDAVERNLIEEIKQEFKENNFTILKEKKIKLEKQEAEKFYKVHQTKPFYNDLCSYLSSGPIVVMVLESENAVLKNRELMGATDPAKAEEGTLRKKFGLSIDKNSVHGSDSLENAKIEKSEAEKFYKVHETKPFYNDLCAYLSSGPIVVMVLEKDNAVLGNRELMGATNPEDAEEGTIRKKYGISIDKNSVHGSDSVENAKIEIDCFFND